MNTTKTEKKTLGLNHIKRAMTIIAMSTLRACCLLLRSLWLPSCQRLMGVGSAHAQFSTLQQGRHEGFNKGPLSEVEKHNKQKKQNPSAGWREDREGPQIGQSTPISATFVWSQKQKRVTKYILPCTNALFCLIFKESKLYKNPTAHLCLCNNLVQQKKARLHVLPEQFAKK